MAEEGQGLSAFFPQPPPFYKYFTSENLERLKEIRASMTTKEKENKQDKSGIGLTQQQLLELPVELRYLIPPEPPTDGKFKVFGDEQDVYESSSTLKDLGLPQLYPSPPSTPSQATGAAASFSIHHAFYLKRIVRSILLNFLELVGILSEEPERYEEKLKDLENLFLNAHALVNEYRPHQARETIILMMEEQIERKRKEIESVQTMKLKIEELLGQLKKDHEDEPKVAGSEDAAKSEENAKREEIVSLWENFDDWDN